MSPSSKKDIVKFARGFKIATKETIHKALKITIKKQEQKTKYENLLLKLIDKFKLIPKPTNDLDWLAQFREIGQTCQDFHKSCPVTNENKIGEKTFIYYVQIGSFEKTKINFDDLIDYSKRFFTEKSIKLFPEIINIRVEEKGMNKRGCKIEIIASIESKNIKKKLKTRYNEETKHYQILTKSLLDLLEDIKPKDSIAFIGLTEADLYVENSDLFVAGLCNGYSAVGVFSCFRYNPKLKFSEEDWFDFKKVKQSKNNTSLLLTRTLKLMVHETNHLLGIDHCVYMDCCMNGSGHLEEDFRQSMFLCPVDLKKLILIFDFDITQRYKNMMQFFQRKDCKEEIKRLEVLIKTLES
jgi:archaemetzincin